jgi:hypothetical protein
MPTNYDQQIITAEADDFTHTSEPIDLPKYTLGRSGGKDVVPDRMLVIYIFPPDSCSTLILSTCSTLQDRL